MGFFKKIKKAFKKTLGTASGGLIGDDGSQKPAAEVAAPVVAPAAPAAAVEAPKEDGVDADSTDTESGRKAARAKGKRGLSVQRQSGSGLNL